MAGALAYDGLCSGTVKDLNPPALKPVRAQRAPASGIFVDPATPTASVFFTGPATLTASMPSIGPGKPR